MAGTLSELLLNKGANAQQQVVDAPAFSLTKVLATGAVIVTPIATFLVEGLQARTDFKAPHYVAIAIGLLGFLAITAAADVLARSIATASKRKADAAQKDSDAARVRAATSAARLVPFATPIDARLVSSEADPKVKVLAAASADEPYLLIQGDDDKITWALASTVDIGK